jgi:hypothetical protein
LPGDASSKGISNQKQHTSLLQKARNIIKKSFQTSMNNISINIIGEAETASQALCKSRMKEKQ